MALNLIVQGHFRSAFAKVKAAELPTAQEAEVLVTVPLHVLFHPQGIDNIHWPSSLCSNGPGALTQRQGRLRWRAYKSQTCGAGRRAGQKMLFQPYGMPS